VSNSLRVASGSRLRDSSLNLLVGSDGWSPISSSVDSGFDIDDHAGEGVAAEVRNVVAIGHRPNESSSVALEVSVFEERDSNAFLHANASHGIVANVVLLERTSVVVAGPKDSSVADNALVVFEKQNVGSLVRHDFDVGGAVVPIVHDGGLVVAESLGAAALVWVLAVGVLAQGQPHALSNHERRDSVVPFVVVAVPLLAQLH